jgi:hypothetical protein
VRADLEYELNHGLYHDAGRMSWETFRETFGREHVAALCANSRRNYGDTGPGGQSPKNSASASRKPSRPGP